MVTAESVTYSVEPRTAEGTKASEVTRSLAEKPALERYGNIAPEELRDVKVEDATFKVGEKSFDCKKVTYVTRKIVGRRVSPQAGRGRAQAQDLPRGRSAGGRLPCGR